MHLVVLHTNDLHGQVLPRRATWLDAEAPPEIGGLPRVAAYLAATRRAAERRGAAVLVVDAGDWSQGTPEGALDGGAGFVRALAAAGFDATCLGNHEFDHGLPALQHLLAEARLPAIAANLRDPATGDRVSWVAPWRIVEAAGLRVALVGLVTPATPEITAADARGILFEDPLQALSRARAELGDRVDLVIPVGHIGVEEGRRLARAHPDLPLVVTGHSHTFLDEGAREGDALVVQAGAKAAVVGRVDLWLDPGTHEARASSARLVELDRAPEAAERVAAVEVLCAELAARSAREMGRVAGELRAPVTRGGGLASTVAGNWVTDAMRRRTGAAVALHNRGGTRRSIEAGPVTRRDLFETLPFANDLVTMTLTGAELEATLRQAVELGAHAGLDVSGMRVHVRDDPPRLVRVEVGGEPLDAAADYRVTTNSFLAQGGDAYAALERGRARVGDPILLRDLLAEELARQSPFVPPIDERFVHVTDE